MIFDLLTAAADASPPSGILHQDRFIPYGELNDRALRAAAALAELGVDRNDVVAIMLPAGIDYIAVLLGCSALGAVAMPLNPKYERAELTFLLRAATPQLVVTDTRAASRCRDALAAAGVAATVTGLEDTPETIGLAGIIAAASATTPVECSADNDAFIFHSSGSTGRSKLIRRSHGQMRAEVEGFAAATDVGQDDCFLSVVPLYHAHGFGNCLLAALRARARLVIAPDGLNALLGRDRLVELAERERATVLPAVPFTFDLLAGAHDGADLSALRLCISAGTALPKPTFNAFRKRFGIPVNQLYGCSEGGALALNTSADAVRTWAAVGRGLGDTCFRILDADADGIGEIAVASSSLTRGYDGQPQVNAASFVDGWFRTGDCGRLDTEGLLYVTGRRSFYIELAGHKVDPYEIEDVLITHPDVREAAVLGVPGLRPGDTLIKAVVVPIDATPTEQALRRWCIERLASYKVPAICECRAELPKSPLGKVLKKYLIEPAAGGDH